MERVFSVGRILLLAGCLLGAARGQEAVADFGNDIFTAQTSPSTIVLPLKLSFEELHMINDYIVEISLLGCPPLNATTARSMKAFMRDRAHNSAFKELHNGEYHEFKAELNKCYRDLIDTRKAAGQTSSTTISTTSTSTSTTTSEAPSLSLESLVPNGATETTEAPQSTVAETYRRDTILNHWNDMLSSFSDMYTKATKFFTRVLRGKRDLRAAAARANYAAAETKTDSGADREAEDSDSESFDHTLQAKQNFEEIIRALNSIVKRVCASVTKYEGYMAKIEEELIFWIRNYTASDIIFLSDSYFSEANLLPLARKCAAA